MSHPSVLIVGGGAFGTSTAYHLSQRGYKNVTVVDKYAPPSIDAAATDLNKIVRYDYPNPLYTKLALEAMSVWKDDASIFSGMFRGTGWLMGAHSMTQGFLKAAYEQARKTGSSVQWMSASQIKNAWPAFTGNFQGWTTSWSPDAGWVPSGEALLRFARAAQSHGVRYITGPSGNITSLAYNEEGQCIGAVAKDGHFHAADTVILCTGANTAALIDAKDEIIARSHCVGIIQLTPEEAQRYKDLPIVDDFEQDKDGLLKLCSCRFITNYHTSHVPGASLGHSFGEYPDDGVPAQIEAEMREFVRDMIPELADRPWSSTRMCWDGDTKDVNFRICAYPNAKNVYIATAGSGHGFKFMPVIGKYVADMLEGKLDASYADLWKWRFGEVPERTGKEPHPYPARDLGELTGWRGRNRRGKMVQGDSARL